MFIHYKGVSCMNKKEDKAILSEKDKKIISQNKNICTESHGKGCDNLPENKINNKLN
jgi:hypothetical protein